jgi:hypothetical protein
LGFFGFEEVMKDFPGNSHSARIEQSNPTAPEPDATVTPSETKVVKKVVTGKVTQNKETLGKKFKRMFLHDGGNFAEHIVEKVVVPTIKDMALSIATQAVDGIRQGVEEALFGPEGSGRRRTTSYGTGRPVVNYTRYSSSSTVRRTERDRDRDSYRDRPRRSNRVKEIIVETREDGDAVLEELDALIDGEVGYCTVGDFYAACGESTTAQDEEWGWKDLSQARVHKLGRDEYLISMPRPRPIET